MTHRQTTRSDRIGEPLYKRSSKSRLLSLAETILPIVFEDMEKVTTDQETCDFVQSVLSSLL